MHRATPPPLWLAAWTVDQQPPTPDTHSTHTHALPLAAGARRSVASFSCSSVTRCRLTNESRSICSELLSSSSSCFFGRHEAAQLRLLFQRKASVRPSFYLLIEASVIWPPQTNESGACDLRVCFLSNDALLPVLLF